SHPIRPRTAVPQALPPPLLASCGISQLPSLPRIIAWSGTLCARAARARRLEAQPRLLQPPQLVALLRGFLELHVTRVLVHLLFHRPHLRGRLRGANGVIGLRRVGHLAALAASEPDDTRRPALGYPDVAHGVLHALRGAPVLGVVLELL